MATLKDLVALVISEYPKPEDLTRARLEKLIYLADVEWAWRYGDKLTDIDWIYNDYGPFVHACDPPTGELEGEGSVKIHYDQTVFGNDKRWHQWIGSEKEVGGVTPEEINVIRSVIKETWRFQFGRFVEYVYSTPPMVQANQYERHDIVRTMTKQRREILEKVTQDNLQRYEQDFRDLAKL